MATELSPEEKVALIRSQLAEVLRFDIIEDVVLKQQRPLKIYWGTATTGRPHCGYFVPQTKIAHFLRAGCRVKVLLADVHGFLDNLKAPWELVTARAQYYKFTIQALLRAVGVPLDKLEFVLGSDYEYNKEYVADLLRMTAITSEHDAKKAGAEVVKQVANPLLSGMIYPLMQALDEQHLDVDAQFGGVDQRKIFTFAAAQLPKLGYKERAHLMNPMVPGLTGGKMSASEEDSKIDLLDPPEVVRKKIRKAVAAPKEPENGLISFIEFVLLPVSALKEQSDTGKFVIERREGDPLVYSDIAALKKDYAEDICTPQLLKAGITDALNALLAPIQAEYQASEEWKAIELKAYPPPEKPKKKEKKPKQYHPKPPNVVAKADGHVEGPDKEDVDIGKSATEAIEKVKV